MIFCLNKDGSKFVKREISVFGDGLSVSKNKDEVAVIKDDIDLDNLLSAIESGEIPVEIGDVISIMKLNNSGREEITLVVTYQDDKKIRFENYYLIANMSPAKIIDVELMNTYLRLPDALKKHIVEVEREHLNSSGERYTKRCKLFAPAASEIFPSYGGAIGDSGIYKQLEWYKDERNRKKSKKKSSDYDWYWTSSEYVGKKNYLYCVSDNGYVEIINGKKYCFHIPFCFYISKTNNRR